MKQTLLVNPPFPKNEWATMSLDRAVADDRFSRWINTYAKAVAANNRIDYFKENEEITAAKLKKVLNRYAKKLEPTLEHIEEMLHLMLFAAFLEQTCGITGIEPQKKKITQLVAVGLIYWGNVHYGFAEA